MIDNAISRLVGVGILLVVTAGGCGNVTSPTVQAEGNYELQAVNGEAPPATVHEDEDPVEGMTFTFVIAGGSLQLAGGTFLTTLGWQVRANGTLVAVENETWTGRYTVNGSTITFTDADGTTVTGTIDGGVITLTEEPDEIDGSLELVFQR